ncbi:MAG: YdiU family protein [Methylococcales bacterium]|nr:YdiU family protein [Methylococcales bacterium]MBT7445405.1 YdiU family protein [Methylococcales bacterium]
MKLNQLNFDHQFAALGEQYFSFVSPSQCEQPHIVSVNPSACNLIGLDISELDHPEFAHYFSGNSPLPGAKPLAMLYCGHQFGHLVSQLGDGRAMMLGQVRNQNEELFDIQLKGAGPTPYSRNADGRAVLRSSIREYLCSEAMHHLGIPTTRALCLIGCSDEIYREQIETGAIVTRLAQSHIRFGSFEVFFYREQFDLLPALADQVIAHSFPTLINEPNKYELWLQHIIQLTAKLIAKWQAVGFCHGVMNTDNMSAIGLTMDYGPFGFLDAFDPKHICNHSDHQGRYAYNQQPEIGSWNLTCLAQAILPLLHEEAEQAVDIAQNALKDYWPAFNTEYQRLFRAKLGLITKQETDGKLVQDFLSFLHSGQLDYTYSFRQLGNYQTNGQQKPNYLNTPSLNKWFERYQQRLVSENSQDDQRKIRMDKANPKYILRNHLCESAIKKAQQNDFTEVNTLLKLLTNPYDEQPEFDDYGQLPPEWARDISVSCSS